MVMISCLELKLLNDLFIIIVISMNASRGVF